MPKPLLPPRLPSEPTRIPSGGTCSASGAVPRRTLHRRQMQPRQSGPAAEAAEQVEEAARLARTAGRDKELVNGSGSQALISCPASLTLARTSRPFNNLAPRIT